MYTTTKYDRLFLKKTKYIECKLLRDVPMNDFTSFKTGGNAEYFISVKNEQALSRLVAAAKESNIPLYVIGNGTNILVSDKGIRGAVLYMPFSFSDISVDGDRITCGAGVPLIKVCNTALENGLTGLEFAFGIPGTAGGAVYMNAGAFDGEIADVVETSSHCSEDGSFHMMKKEELEFGYRQSFYTQNKDNIITSVTFKLSKGNKDDIKKRMDEIMSRRKAKQPLEYPSAGSTFKRPEGNFAGALIEQCGLKGYCIGGAQVSEKHAGFIINRYGCTSEDIENLMKHVEDTVKEKTGILLQPEIKFLP